MNRKPEIDWWDAPKIAEEAPEPNTKEELRTIEREMQDHIEFEDSKQKMREFHNTPMSKQQFVSTGSPEPHLLDDLDAATAITVTMRPAVFLEFKLRLQMLHASEEILLHMRGGDLWLMKDRQGRSPALLQQGHRPWYEHKVKGKRR